MANRENVDSSGLRARRESLVSREGQGPEDHLEWRVPREILELQDSPETLENRDQVVSRESQAAQAKMAKRAIEASRAIQVHLASLASRVQQGSPVRLDHRVNRVMPGHQASKGISARWGRLASKVHQATRVHRDQKAAQVWLATRDLQERWDPRGSQESRGHQENLEMSVHLDSREPEASEVRRAIEEKWADPE
jgi:hypothetical protein